MLRGNIAATSLKILWKNLYSVKCYDKSNINAFALSRWENFRRGLIYFASLFGLDHEILVIVLLPWRAGKAPREQSRQSFCCSYTQSKLRWTGAQAYN